MSIPNKRKYKGYGALFFSTFLYGWIGVLVKVVGSQIPIFYQQFSRYLIITVVIFAYFKITHQVITRPSKRDVLWVLLRSLSGALSFVTMYVAFERLSIGLTYLVFYGGAVISGFVVGAILNQEHMTKWKTLALLLLVPGIYLAYGSRIQQQHDVVFMAFAFISGAFSTLWAVFSQKIKGNHSAMELNFYDSSLFTILNLIVSFVVVEHWVAPCLSMPWFASAGMAVVFLATGALMVYGYRRVEAQIATIIMPLEIVFGIVLGYLVLRDQVNTEMVVGSILIITATALPYVGERLHTMRSHTL